MRDASIEWGLELARGKRAAQADRDRVEGLGELPNGWRWERLGAVLPLEYGKALSAKVRSPSGEMPVFGSSGLVGSHDVALTGGPTVVVGRKGSAGAVHYSPIACWPIDTAYYVRPQAGMNLRFAFHLLSHLRLGGLDQSTAIPSLSRDTYSDVVVAIPPADRQMSIAARIDALFAEIDEGEAALDDARAGVETYRKSLLQAAVTGELTADWRRENPPQESGADLLQRILAERRALWEADPKNGRKKYAEPDVANVDDLPTLPNGWIWAKMEQLGLVTGGLTQNRKRDALPFKVPFLRVANVYANRLDLRVIEQIGLQPAELDRVLLRHGDMLIVEGNGSIDQIGRSAIWDDSISPCAHQNHLIKVRFAMPQIGAWVQSWLQSLAGRRELEDRASSTSGLHTLSISKVSALRIPIPSLAEMAEAQRKNTDLATRELKADEVLDSLSGDASILRQSILRAAFCGELS